MKAIMKLVWVGMVMTLGAGCDGMVAEEPGVTLGALSTGTSTDDVIVDGGIVTGENPWVKRKPRPAVFGDGYVVTSGGDVEVINDFATEDDGPGVVRDCSASATKCNASCTLTGEGTCTSTTHSASCTLVYPCGDAVCETTTTASCVD